MSDTVERVYRAMHTIQADGLPVDRFSIKVHPAIREEVHRSASRLVLDWVTPDPTLGGETVFGLPFETDPSLAEGQIVLFYEVRA